MRSATFGPTPGVRATITADRELACRYERTFARKPDAADTETAMVDAAKAIGAFVEHGDDAVRAEVDRWEPETRAEVARALAEAV